MVAANEQAVHPDGMWRYNPALNGRYWFGAGGTADVYTMFDLQIPKTETNGARFSFVPNLSSE